MHLEGANWDLMVWLIINNLSKMVELTKSFVLQDAYHRVLPQESPDLPSMPSLDDCVDELVGEAGPSGLQSIPSLVAFTSPSLTNSAQSIQPAPTSASTSGSKMISFTIIFNDTRASILVKRLEILNYLKNNLIISTRSQKIKLLVQSRQWYALNLVYLSCSRNWWAGN